MSGNIRTPAGPIGAVHAYPHYGEAIGYIQVADQLRPWEYSGWKAESLSWKQSC